MIILPPPIDQFMTIGVLLLSYVVSTKWLEWLLPREWNYRIAVSRLISVIWFGAAMWITGSGLLTQFNRTPPPMAMMIAAVVIVSILIGLSSFGRNAAAMPILYLVGLQAFRLPLELLMHRGVTLGIVPVELSYTGYNFDIVTGIGAALIAIALMRGVSVPRGAIWLWNLYGFFCLAAILAIAVLGSPMLHRFGTDPRHVNTWVLFFPYVLVPVTLVVTALSGHIVITRKLLSAAV